MTRKCTYRALSLSVRPPACLHSISRRVATRRTETFVKARLSPPLKLQRLST